MKDELDFDKWESAIGKLILSCSRVEFELLRLYEKWLPSRKYHKDSYIDRFDKAIGVANRSLNQGSDVADLLIAMKKYAKLRHMVAHNPIHYSSSEDAWFIFDLKSGESAINISNLEQEAKLAGALSTRLCILLRVNV